MFISNNTGNVSIGVPDACVVGPVVVPEVNIALSPANIPTVPNVIVGGGIPGNLVTITAASTADVGVGVVSGMCMGPKRPLFGSTNVLMGAIPVSKVTSPTGQNGLVPNAPGMIIVPSQFNVLALS